ncbi:hypothetical protein N8592_02390 [Verrucomicrobia bacterium]|nr:hypothetical protein [Verrucomicrobiota bacterium]
MHRLTIEGWIEGNGIPHVVFFLVQYFGQPPPPSYHHWSPWFYFAGSCLSLRSPFEAITHVAKLPITSQSRLEEKGSGIGFG